MKLSKIYNLAATVDDRFKDNNFKDREAKAFEIMFPETKIIKDNYRNEIELDNDWQKYCELPYHLKVLANETCLRLYGLKNEQQYLKLKAQFVKKDIENNNIFTNTYIPKGLKEDADVDEEWLNKQADDYMNKGGHPILRINYDFLDDLNHDWYQFNNQGYDYKVVSNNKSLEIYGKTVPEVYRTEIKKFLQKDIKNSSLDDLSISPSINNNSLAATEAVCEAMRTSYDVVERLVLLELTKSKISTPVEKSLLELAEMKIKNELSDVYENYLGYYNYLLPQEIINLYEDAQVLEDDPLFLNYAIRGIGFQPLMENFQEEVRKLIMANKDKQDPARLVRIGWNPVLEGTEENRFKSAKRANKVLKENMNCIFLDLAPNMDLLTEEEIKEENNSLGLAVLMIQELDEENQEKVSEVPKIMLSLDYSDSSWQPLIYGRLLPKQPVDDVIAQFHWPFVSCYFVELSPSLYERVKTIGIEQFNEFNLLQRLTELLQSPTPHIGNKKLLFHYLLNALLANNDDSFSLKEKIVVQMLYSGFMGKYEDVLQSFSKLKLLKNKELPLKESFLFQEAKVVLDESCIKERPTQYFKLAHADYTDSWPEFKRVLNLQF